MKTRIRERVPLCREWSEMRRALEAIRTATINTADLLGWKLIGSIEPGSLAAGVQLFCHYELSNIVECQRLCVRKKREDKTLRLI